MTDLHAKPRLTTIEVRNPADGTVVGEVPNDSAETVAAKDRELRIHQPEWEAMGPRGRKPRRKARLAMGIMCATAAHGIRRLGLKPKGGRK